MQRQQTATNATANTTATTTNKTLCTTATTSTTRAAASDWRARRQHHGRGRRGSQRCRQAGAAACAEAGAGQRRVRRRQPYLPNHPRGAPPAAATASFPRVPMLAGRRCGWLLPVSALAALSCSRRQAVLCAPDGLLVRLSSPMPQQYWAFRSSMGCRAIRPCLTWNLEYYDR